MLFVARQLFARFLELRDIDDLSVDTGARESLTQEVGEQRLVLALSSAHYRCQYLESRSLLQFHHLVDDLFGSLFGQPLPVVNTVLHADSCIQETQIVVHLGDRADGGTRVP